MLVVEAAPVYHREYLVRLPLPLAQLYIRAFNAKDARARHDNSFYLFECLIKLVACPLIAAYLQELRHGTGRDEKLDRLLAQLALPSLGQWLGFGRETSRLISERPDADIHPMGHIYGQLTQKRKDVPGALALFNEIKNGPDGKRAGGQSVSLLELFTALVQYRNIVFGHGASRDESFYEDVMGPLLFPAVNDALQAGWIDLLGPPDSQLVFIREVKRADSDSYEVHGHSLVGMHGERMQPIRVPIDSAADLVPNAVYLYWVNNRKLVPIEPLVAFREGGISEEVLFLNRDRNAKQVEFLSYTTGRTERDKSTADSMRQLLATITGDKVSGNEFSKLIDKSRKADPTKSSDREDEEGDSDSGRIRIDDFEVLTEIARTGSGIVYLARQLTLGRVVALKMLPTTMTDEDARERFQREVTALAQCEHPSIVKVLASGRTPSGQLYYAMEYVSGANLAITWDELAGRHASEDVSSLGSDDLMTAVLSASQVNRDDTHMKVFSMEDDEEASSDSVGKLTLSRFNMPRVPILSELLEEEALRQNEWVDIV
jgi:hypothetical protein